MSFEEQHSVKLPSNSKLTCSTCNLRFSDGHEYYRHLESHVIAIEEEAHAILDEDKDLVVKQNYVEQPPTYESEVEKKSIDPNLFEDQSHIKNHNNKLKGKMITLKDCSVILKDISPQKHDKIIHPSSQQKEEIGSDNQRLVRGKAIFTDVFIRKPETTILFESSTKQAGGVVDKIENGKTELSTPIEPIFPFQSKSDIDFEMTNNGSSFSSDEESDKVNKEKNTNTTFKCNQCDFENRALIGIEEHFVNEHYGLNFDESSFSEKTVPKKAYKKEMQYRTQPRPSDGTRKHHHVSKDKSRKTSLRSQMKNHPKKTKGQLQNTVLTDSSKPDEVFQFKTGIDKEINYIDSQGSNDCESSEPHTYKSADKDAKTNAFKGRRSCSLCGKSLASLGTLNQHKPLCEIDQLLARGEISQDEALRRKKPFQRVKKKGRFECKYCDKVYDNKWHCEKHISQHEKGRVTCDICNETYINARSLNVHRKSVHFPELKCDVCGKKYGDKSLLARHTISHSEPSLPCDQCGKKFTCKKKLDRHVLRVHEIKGKTWPCEHCAKLFKTQHSLDGHVRNMHGKRIKHMCSKCSFVSYNLYSLRVHEEGHLRLEYKCSVCPKVFPTKAAMNRHEGTHTLERKFACDVCNDKFKKPHHLANHMLKHTGAKNFSCTECGKRFGRQQILDTHMLSHTGEKAFSCCECGKDFFRKTDLNRHMREQHSDSAGVERY